MSLKNAPEIKALLAIDKQLSPLSIDAQRRLIIYFHALYGGAGEVYFITPKDECQE